MTIRRLSIIFLILVFAQPAAAEWYDDYFDGLDAVKNKSWSTVVQKMSSAISQKPNEEKKAKTYGVQFIAYHPYYYRGVAYMNQGKWSEAVEDLKRATGVGEVNLGDPATLLINANQQLVAEQIKAQQPSTPPSQPTPTPEPAGPDPRLVAARESAERAIQTARSKLNRAQQVDASMHAPSDFDSASNLLKRATSANVNASTVADYNDVANLADRAARAFDAAVTNAELKVAELERQRRSRQQRPPTPAPTTREPEPSPARATEDALSETKTRLKRALEAYFDGDFERSASQLEQLALDQPNNAMIYAFLGASRYYDYYLGGQSDASSLQRAKQALRQAKDLNPSLQLSADYFSPRIRGFFQQID
ncbi:MAG: tetratricopeptide repeat protein [Thermoanaerobaculia bacterium]|nr:tetratricopeptide repeat protein [Thermoanaerobaculia bacterium]